MLRGASLGNPLLPKSRGALRGPVIPNLEYDNEHIGWFKDRNLVDQYDRNLFTSTEFRGRFGQLIQIFITSAISPMARVITGEILPVETTYASSIDVQVMMMNGGILNPRGDLGPSTKTSISESMLTRKLKQYGRAIDIDGLLRSSPDFMTFFDMVLDNTLTDMDNTLTVLAWNELYRVGAGNLQREYTEYNGTDSLGVQFARLVRMIGVSQTVDADIATRYLVGMFSNVFPNRKPYVWIDNSAKRFLLPSAVQLSGTEVSRKMKEDLEAAASLYRQMPPQDSLLLSLGGVDIHVATPMPVNGVMNTRLRKDRGMLEREMILMEYERMESKNKSKSPYNFTSESRDITVKGGPEHDTFETVTFKDALANSWFFNNKKTYTTHLMSSDITPIPKDTIKVTDEDIIYAARVKAAAISRAHTKAADALDTFVGRHDLLFKQVAPANRLQFFETNEAEPTIGATHASLRQVLTMLKYWNPQNELFKKQATLAEQRQFVFTALFSSDSKYNFMRSLSPLEFICGIYTMFDVYDKDTVLLMCSVGLYVPVSVTLWRAMYLKCTDLLGSVGGRDFGRTFYISPDLEYGSTPYTKEAHYHLTMDAASIIVQPDGVQLMPGFTIEGFVAGMNTGVTGNLETFLSPEPGSPYGIYPVVYDNVDEKSHPAITNILGMDLVRGKTTSNSFLSYAADFAASLHVEELPDMLLLDMFDPTSQYRLYCPGALGPYSYVMDGVTHIKEGNSYPFSNEGFYAGSARVHSKLGRTNHPASIPTY